VQQRNHCKLRFERNLISLVFSLLLVGCETKTPMLAVTGFSGSTLTPVSTTRPEMRERTTVPSETLISTLVNSSTSTPILVYSPTYDLPLPSGNPVSSWNGIPIMPDAISGEEKEDGYSYTIKAFAEQVMDFYNAEMSKIGWKFYTTGRGETGSLLLMYQKDDKTCTVSIFDHGGLTLVLLIQY
jgi:hypothetical protein